MIVDRHNCFIRDPIRQEGRPGALAIAVKDNIDVNGMPTRAGLDLDLGNAHADAPVVRVLREAGFTLVGKAQMDEMAFGGTGENPHFGRTKNPRVHGHSPGGSSSGPAAAIAAGLCEAGLGTDTLGSVRIPAAYCGIVGLKPSRGLLSVDGVWELSATLDHVGLMAATTGQVAEMLAAFTPRPAAPVALRVGVPDNLPGVDPETMAVCQQALARSGWQTTPCRIADWDPVRTRLAGLLVIEAEAGEKYAAFVDSRDGVMSDGLKRMLRYGQNCGSGRLVRAIRMLRAATAGLDQALAMVDLIALPTVPSPAFRWRDGPPDNQGELTALANYGGHPAISVPVAPGADGRPIGLQLIGRLGADWLVLEAAARIEALYA